MFTSITYLLTNLRALRNIFRAYLSNLVRLVGTYLASAVRLLSALLKRGALAIASMNTCALSLKGFLTTGRRRVHFAVAPVLTAAEHQERYNIALSHQGAAPAATSIGVGFAVYAYSIFDVPGATASYIGAIIAGGAFLALGEIIHAQSVKLQLKHNPELVQSQLEGVIRRQERGEIGQAFNTLTLRFEELRAANAAQQLANQTNTAFLISVLFCLAFIVILLILLLAFIVRRLGGLRNLQKCCFARSAPTRSSTARLTYYQDLSFNVKLTLCPLLPKPMYQEEALFFAFVLFLVIPAVTIFTAGLVYFFYTRVTNFPTRWAGDFSGRLDNRRREYVSRVLGAADQAYFFCTRNSSTKSGVAVFLRITAIPPQEGFFVRTLSPLRSSYSTQTYYSLGLYLLLTLAICGLLAVLAYLFSLSAVQDGEKRSEYECGFEPFDSATRLPFDVHFYLVGILFLIFDVEIALLFPWVLGLRTIGWFGFYLRLGFIALLAVGFLYEWKRGALIWPSRQQEITYIPSSIILRTSGYSPLEQYIVLCERGGLTYGEQFSGYFVPENARLRRIVYLLCSLAVELGSGRSKKELGLESLVGVQFGLIFIAVIYAVQLKTGFARSLFNGYFLTNGVVVSLKLLTLLAGLFILNRSNLYLRESELDLLEYAIVRTLSLLFRVLLVISGNLRAAFLCVVGFSLNLYVLILFEAAKFIAREAGAKYYFLSTFSSGRRIYGIFLLFVAIQTATFYDMAQILGTCFEIVASHKSRLQIGTTLLLTGVFFKLSAFPGHLWAAEVYEGSSDPVMGFFRLPVKISALAFLSSFLRIAIEPVAGLWQPYVAFSAFSSLLWGCFRALHEKKTKRFLAYASINQIGFLLLGLACASREGYRSTLLYLVIYSLSNVGFLTVFLDNRRADGRSRLYLTDFRGLSASNWLRSWSLARILFSRAGIPPLAGFFGKYFLLRHAQELGLYGLVFAGLFTSLLSTYYYIRLIKRLWFEGQDGRTEVTCTFTAPQQVFLFGTEAVLFAFALFVGPVLEQRNAALAPALRIV